MVDILMKSLNETVMTTRKDDNRSKPSGIGKNRWTRVREAYQSGELDRQNIIFQPEQKRARRNALADISAVSTNADASSQKHQFHQLVERVRELQKEIVPDLLLYQMPPNYSPFSPVTPSSNASRGSISMYPRQQSISMNSVSSNSSISNQKFGLSARILERAHQIPERFWIDWQQKQMQDQIEELEYIKNNIDCGSSSSLVLNGTDENGMDPSVANRGTNYDEMRRKSVLFLHEAQRLANERRASQLRQTTMDASISNHLEKISDSSENDDHNSFNFDQRSEETIDTANLNDLNEISPTIPIAPDPSVEPSSPALDRSRLTVSLPFTYTNTREQTRFSNNYRQIFIEPMLQKVIEVRDDATQTSSPTNSIEDVAKIDTELNLTLLKREYSESINPLLYSKATVKRSIEFRPFRLILSRNTTMTSREDIPISISISKRKEIDNSRSCSPTLSFKSVRSRFSSFDDGDDLDVDNRSSSVIPSSLSVFSLSRSSSSHIISTITQYCDHNDNYYYNTSLKPESSHRCTYFTQNQSMINVYDLEQKYNSSSCSSFSITPFEEEDEVNLSFLRTLFTSPHQQRRRTKKGNTSNLSLVWTPSSQNNITLLRDLLCQAKENDHNNNQKTLKIAHNTSIISSRNTREWKQNNSGFQRVILTNDNNDNNVHGTRSSSSAAAAAADCLIRRQRRKQTRLKRKTGSEKRKEKKKKKKKERNKKSHSSNTVAEATEPSLFQFFAVDTPTIDTSAISYPYEQANCAGNSAAKKENCFSTQTSREHHHQQQKQQFKFNLTMADGHGCTTPNPSLKKKDNVRVFVRRRRRTTKHQKRVFRHSSSSNNSHETIPSSSSSTNVEELVSLIQQQIKNKQKKSRNHKNIIVVNYKPVFVNSRQQKPSPTTKTSPIPIPKPKFVPTDDDFSSATHYSRQRSLTTTSSDGSPLRSTTNRIQHQQSVSLDVPDVEDPLMFIELMYQQLFTEDGQLRSGTEPTVLANCVKQIVTNSRRNSISSSIANGSTSSSRLKHTHSNSTNQQRKFSSSSYQPFTPSKPISSSSSPRLIPNEYYDTFSEEEEEEEEPETVVQINTDASRRNAKRLNVNNPDNHSQIHAFLNSSHQTRPPPTTNNAFHFSIDDTDNEDLDTFSDLNSIRFNNKIIRTSPSVDEDLTQTDSKLLSSSGYQSLDRSRKSFQQQKPILSKSHSENDLSHPSHKHDTHIKCIHCCSNCIHPRTRTVIPPVIPTSSSSNIIQRIQQPVGIMLMKYLHFILVSKNVLLLPLFIFFLRQRSMHLGN